MSPPGQTAPGASSPLSGHGLSDYAAQYAQYYGAGAQDPYAAYGGYAAYVRVNTVLFQC
jgi:hypothetical protein